MPAAIQFLGDAQLPAIQLVHNIADSLPDGGLFQQFAVLPRLLY